MLTIFLWSNAWFWCIDGVAGIMPIIICPSCNSTNTRFCHERVLLRIHAFVAKRVSLQIHAFLGLFGADFYADIKDLTQILCIYLDLKSAAGISDILVELNLVFVKSTTYWAGRAVYPTQVTWKAKFKCYAIILHLDRSITGDPQTSTGEDNEVTGDGLLGKGAQ